VSEGGGPSGRNGRLRTVVPGKLALFGRVFGDPGLAPFDDGSADADGMLLRDADRAGVLLLAVASFGLVST